MRVQSLGQEDSLEKEMATHSSIPAWEIPWTEDPDGLQSMASLSQVGYGPWHTTVRGDTIELLITHMHVYITLTLCNACSMILSIIFHSLIS